MQKPLKPGNRSSRIAMLILLLGGIALGVSMAYFTIIMGPANPLAAAIPNPLNSIPDNVSIDQPAPDFTAQTPDGKVVRLSDLRGSIVALNFWATWCGPCRVEMPELESAVQRYSGAHLVVLGVNAGEQAAQVTSYMTELQLHFQTVLDPNGDIVDQYQIRAFPTTIWLDSKGIVRARHLGPLTREFIDRYVSDLSAR